MKTYKTLTTITIMLAIAILVLASFFGAYKLEVFKVSNIIPNYLLGMEFEDKRILTYEVDSSVKDTKVYDSEGNLVEEQEGIEYTEANGYKTEEELVNAKEILTKENYQKTKEILTERLQLFEAEQYIIRLDEETGKIIIEVPENDKAEDILEKLGKNGKFEIIDYDTQDVLLSQENLKESKVLYNSEKDGSTTVYLCLAFDSEGTNKLKEISTTYVEVETEETENEVETEETENEVETVDNGNSEETEEKYVSMLFNGETYIDKTAFSEEYSDGQLYLTFGSSADTKQLQKNVKNASDMSNLLKSGVLPIEYTLSDTVYESTIDKEFENIALYVFVGLNLLSFIYLIIKFKKDGLVAIMLQLGYIATLLIMLRVTNVFITLEGIVGIIISIILNYIFTLIIFNEVVIENKEMKIASKKVFGKFALATIPIYVIAIIFTFASLLYSSSLGMTLVWGSIILYLYNLVFTNILLRVIIKED